MVDGGADHFHFAGAQVALEVAGIVVRVPEAPLHIGEQGYRLGRAALVGQLHLADLAVVVHGDEGEYGSLQSVFLACEAAVADAVAALIGVELRLSGFPAGIPHRVSLFNIEVFAVDIVRDVVVAVAGHAQQFGVLVESVAAAGIRDQREELAAAQIVDPRQGRLGGGDDILAVGVIKVTEFHSPILLCS